MKSKRHNSSGLGHLVNQLAPLLTVACCWNYLLVGLLVAAPIGEALCGQQIESVDGEEPVEEPTEEPVEEPAEEKSHNPVECHAMCRPGAVRRTALRVTSISTRDIGVSQTILNSVERAKHSHSLGNGFRAPLRC